MLTLRTKKITRQCFVPGCRNLNTVMVFRGRDPWAKVVICPDCAKELYKNLFPTEETESVSESDPDVAPEEENDVTDDAPALEDVSEEEKEAESDVAPEEEKAPEPQAKPRQRKPSQNKDKTT